MTDEPPKPEDPRRPPGLPPRKVGLPHPLVQNDRLEGPRRLSDAELEEVDRLILGARRLSDPVNLFLYALPYAAFVALWLNKHTVLGILFVLLLFCTLGYAYRVSQHVHYTRLRKNLERGKEDGSVFGFFYKGQHFENLGRGLIWTIDGEPAKFRTEGPL